MEQTNRLVNAGLQINLGEGKRIEVELEGARFWVALGPPLDAEVWIKDVAGHQNFRVRVERTPDGLVVSLGRGPGTLHSWPEENPRIGVTIEPGGRRGIAYVWRGEQAVEIWRGDFPL
jgi:hypothetical protein